MQKKQLLIWAAACIIMGFLILTISITTSPVSAQDDGDNLTISNGTYVGSHLVEGMFFMDLEIPEPDQEAYLIWDGKLDGPLEFESAFGNLIGEWSISGEAAIESGIGELIFSGTQTTSATGAVAGYISRPAFDSTLPEDPLDSIDLEGAATITTEMYSSSALGPQRSVTEETLSVNLQITEFIASCNQVNGSWTWQIDQELDAAQLMPGLDSNFFVVKSEPDEQLQADLLGILKDLQSEGTGILLEINNGNIDSPQIIQWLDKANRAITSIKKDLECGLALDKSQYLSPITHLTCEMTKSIARNAPSTFTTSNPKIYAGYYVAVSNGCFGSGSFSPEQEVEYRDSLDRALADVFKKYSADSKDRFAKQFADAANVTGSDRTRDAVESWLNDQVGGE